MSALTLSRARLAAPAAAVDRVPAEAPRHASLVATCALTGSIGLALVAAADTAALGGHGAGGPLFWVGLATLFLPPARLLAGARASRRERLLLLELLGVELYLVKLFHSPLWFDFHDELGQWRSTDDVVQSGHLFHANPIVAVYPHYPGLETVTAGVVQLSGLSIFAAGLIVIAVARIVFVPALQLFFEKVGGSTRAAGVGVLIYMANPNFLFFDADYSYESLALALGIVVLLLAARSTGRAPGRNAFRAAALLAAAALVVTHHASSYAIAAYLLAWSVLEIVLSRRRRLRVGVVAVAVGAMALAWLVVEGRTVATIYGPIVGHAVSATVDLVTGKGVKQPFASGSGPHEGVPEQVLGFASVVLLLGGLALALLRGFWVGARDRTLANRALLALGCVAILYPATLLLRLTSAGTETSNRSSEFVFVGLGLVIALGAVEVWLAADAPGGAHRLRPLAFAILATVAFLGGVVVGWPPYARLPGSYLPGGDTRSITPQGVAAAYWAREELAPRSRIASDRGTSLLMASYGRLNPETGTFAGDPVARIFASARFGPRERRIVSGDKIRYLVVERRLSQAPPASGSYFDDAPGLEVPQPIPSRMLDKFERVDGLSRVYDGGDIVVYDTVPLR